MEQISIEHSKLRGKSRSSACYLTLGEVSELPTYGCELHRATSPSGADVTFVVGPEGIVIEDNKTSSIRRLVYITVILSLIYS